MAGIVAARLRTKQSAWPWERLAAAGGLCWILVALSMRTNVYAAGAAALIGATLIGWTLWPQRPGRWLRFSVANAAVAALFVWAGAERLHLTIDLAEDRLVAAVGEARMQAIVPTVGGHVVTVALASADQRPLHVRWAYATLPVAAGIADWLNTGLLAGVENLSVETVTGERLLGPGPLIWQPMEATGPPVPDGPLGGWELAERDGEYILMTSRPYAEARRISLDLVRPSSTVTVGIRRSQDAGGTLAVVVAPDHRTMSIERQHTSEGATTLAGGLFAFKRSSTQWLQAIGREALRSWLWALAALGLCRALAGLPARGAGNTNSRIPAAPVAWLLGLGTLAVTGVIAKGVLEGIPHVQDSVTYLFQAQLFALGQFSAPAPPLPQFFEQEFVVVHDGRWFGKYSPGHPLVLALGVLAGVPWLVSPLASAGSVALTYLAGRRLFGHATGLVAAGLLLVSPFFLFLSGSMMAHAVGLFWTSVALYAASKAGQRRPLWLLTLGLAVGMLLITRPLTAAVAVPIVGLAIFASIRSLLDTGRFAVLSGFGAVGPLAFMLAFNWTLLGDPLRNPYELWWSFDRPGFGPGVGMHGPHDVANGLANSWANMTELMRHLFGWPGYLTLVPALVPLVALSDDYRDWLLALCPLALAGAYVFYWADGIMFGPRYYFEAIGALSLLSARGLAKLAQPIGPGRHAGAEKSALHRGLAPYAVGVAATALISVALLGYMPPMIRLHQGYNGVSRARLDLVERAELRDALVFVTQTWPDWQHYGSVFPANGPLLAGNVIYARDLGPDQNPRLMAVYPDRRPYLLRGLELYAYQR